MIKHTNLIVTLAAIYDFAQGRNSTMPRFKPGSDLGKLVNLSGDQSGVHEAFDDQVSVGCPERTCFEGYFDF